jgi:hypothetical protein
MFEERRRDGVSVFPITRRKCIDEQRVCNMLFLFKVANAKKGMTGSKNTTHINVISFTKKILQKRMSFSRGMSK